MPKAGDSPSRETKGERTSRRILDVAEDLFARQGYGGTSLRQIASGVGIKEPGLYNHFASKQSLYEAVLFRALNPMTEALTERLESASELRDYTDLPATMTDLLSRHPQMASLFQQALRGGEDSIGSSLVLEWLETLFAQGMRSLEDVEASHAEQLDKKTLAIEVIAMFNLVTGYFLSQRVFADLAGGELTDPDNIALQKELLRKVIRAMLVS